jgi:hypothetical protein
MSCFSGAFQKLTHSRRSRDRGSSSHHSEAALGPISTDREEEGEEELPTPQVDEVYAIDAAFIDLRIARDKPTLSSRTESSPTPRSLTQTFSRKQVWTPSSIPFGKLYDGRISSEFRRLVLDLPPFSFSAPFKRMRLVFHFDFMEFRIEFRGNFLVAPSVFIIIALSLLRNLALVLIMRVFGKRSLVVLFTTS